MNKRKILIITSSVIVVAAGSYFTYTKIRNNNEIKEINNILDSGKGEFGSIEDFMDVFTGNQYISKIKAKYPNIILLKPNYVTVLRTQLYLSIVGLGTNENAIKTIFSKLKDKIQIAQISQSYQNNYGENLLSALKDDMDPDSQDMKELLMIVKNKPDYRVSRS